MENLHRNPGRVAAHEDNKDSGHKSTVYIHKESDENIDEHYEDMQDHDEDHKDAYEHEDQGKYPSESHDYGDQGKYPAESHEYEEQAKYPSESHEYEYEDQGKYPSGNDENGDKYDQHKYPNDNLAKKKLYGKHRIPRPRPQPSYRPKTSRRPYPSLRPKPHPLPLDADPFTCEGKAPGYYADVNTNCEEYKICVAGHPVYTQRCGRGTIFNQRFLVCDHPFNYDCKKAPDDYQSNVDYHTFISE